METIATKKLTLLKEVKKKTLTNSKGEPYVLHEVVARSAEKGKEFAAIMFLGPEQELEFGVEKQYSIGKANQPGSYLLREVKPSVTAKGYPVRNVTLDVWKIALDTACSIATSRDVPSILAIAGQIAKHIRKEL